MSEDSQGRCAKTCPACGKTFRTNAARQVRCDDCSKCRMCGAWMDSRNAESGFCTRSCERAWAAESSPESVPTCRYCGGLIVPDRKSGAGARLNARVTCGADACRTEHNRVRNRIPGADPLAGRFGIGGKGKAEQHWNWKGGVTPVRQSEMAKAEYKLWRFTVYKRDGFACILCGATGNIHAHHIRLWADHPELRYDVANGVTLCEPHHVAIRRREAEFEQEFLAYVASRQPVLLTPEELGQFEPLLTNCDYCGAQLVRQRSQRAQAFHFCDKAHYLAFSTSMGVRWKVAVAAKQKAQAS